jgi:transglutaminase-like putative cysteine protease
LVGESHARVEAWTGTWSGYDPTNRAMMAEHHVLVARGAITPTSLPSVAFTAARRAPLPR